MNNLTVVIVLKENTVLHMEQSLFKCTFASPVKYRFIDFHKIFQGH